MRRDKYILERRHADGSLDLKGEQAPRNPYAHSESHGLYWTEDNLAKYYFARNPGEGSVEMSVIREWFADRGWSYRPVTW